MSSLPLVWANVRVNQLGGVRLEIAAVGRAVQVVIEVDARRDGLYLCARLCAGACNHLGARACRRPARLQLAAFHLECCVVDADGAGRVCCGGAPRVLPRGDGESSAALRRFHTCRTSNSTVGE